MRASWLWVSLFSAACATNVATKQGSMEYAVQQYTAAALASDDGGMDRHAPDVSPPKAPGDKDLRGYHVVKLCQQGGSEDGTRRDVAVLIGSRLDNSLYGLYVVAKKDGSDWRITNARYDLNPDGTLKRYLRNCDVDMGSDRGSTNFGSGR
jgi:hypothetical protein